MSASPGKSDSLDGDEDNATEAAGGLERSAERDAKSHQAIGEQSRETERKIGRQMPDRK